MSWIEEINAKQVITVAAALGLQVRGQHFGPCPACREDRRSSQDRRKCPVYAVHGGQGWKCQRCGATGSATSLAERVLFNDRLPAGDARWVQVRALCAQRGLCSAPSEHVDVPPVAPPRPARAEFAPPRPADVVAAWDACVSVEDDELVSAWLRSRHIDPAIVAERGLARALPRTMPAWAKIGRHPWSTGWRCIFPAFDGRGRLASLRARWVRPGEPPESTSKAVAPALGPGSASGLLHADAGARALLQTGSIPAWPRGRPLRLIVAEGEPDYLTHATRWPNDVHVPAVLSIWSGSWSDEIASRVPDGCHVAIVTHHDEAGDRYADKIARSLAGRCVLVRSRPRVAS